MRIGYYDVETGAGVAEQGDIITGLGQNAFLRTDLQASDTQRAGVLFVQNGDPLGYDGEFTASAANLIGYVGNGGVMIFHDVAVTTASTLLSTFGVGGAVVAPGAGSGVDFAGSVTPVTSGPAGLLTDDSLDGAPLSAGYVGIDSIQDEDVAVLATRTDPSQGITLLAAHGAGYLIYSTIDLEAYLADFTPIQAAVETYAGNLVRYATRLSQAQDVLLDDTGNVYATTAPGEDVFGGAGDDVIEANHKRALAHGRGGDDLIDLSGHADLAWGGEGADTVLGSHADDQLWGGAGDDRLKGSNGGDFQRGGT